MKISADKATNSLVIAATTKDYYSLRAVIKKLDIPRRQVFVEATIMEITLDKTRGLRGGVARCGAGGTGGATARSSAGRTSASTGGVNDLYTALAAGQPR